MQNCFPLNFTKKLTELSLEWWQFDKHHPILTRIVLKTAT